MNSERLKVGLVIAKTTDPISQVEHFIDEEDCDVVVFPEGHFPSKDLPRVQQVAQKSQRWIITGMEDRRTSGSFYQTGLAIDPHGKIVGEHKKTSLTRYEIGIGQNRGDKIETIPTAFGLIGIAVCYELHLPEVARIYALDGARIIFNPIGTGMWHEHQFEIWNSTAQARAAENGTFVLGVSHFNDSIPIAFSYAPNGECLLKERSANRLIPTILDFNKYTIGRNFDQRRPELYDGLTK